MAKNKRQSKGAAPIAKPPPPRQGRKPWTREDSIVVLNLYCRIPFSQSRASHPEVVRTARLLGRTPASVNFKIGNFGSFDPELKKRGIGGLPNVSELDRRVWEEFNGAWERLAQESARLVFEAEARRPPSAREFGEARIGKEKMRLSKSRVNQQFFREAILAAYGGRCCVTGLAIPTLLVASHIKPWAKCGKTEKLSPRNGLCLNALHDRAFDRGLITVGADFRLRASRALSSAPNAAAREMLLRHDGRKISLPEKFVPDSVFLDWHGKNCFLG